MKRLLIFIMILCVALWLGVGAQEDMVEPVVTETKGEVVVPATKPVTRLDVTIIDEMNDQFIKLENCIVQVLGELHMVEDSFNYSNTFVEGDRYNMTIWIKAKE